MDLRPKTVARGVSRRFATTIPKAKGHCTQTDDLNVVLCHNTHQPVLPNRQAEKSAADPSSGTNSADQQAAMPLKSADAPSPAAFRRLISRHDAIAAAATF